jgi:hypothetical protein
MARNFIGPVENVIEVLGSIFIATYIPLMPNSQILASLGRAFFVTKEENLYVWVQQRPTLKRIALDKVAVAMKGFWSRKYRQHVIRLPR